MVLSLFVAKLVWAYIKYWHDFSFHRRLLLRNYASLQCLKTWDFPCVYHLVYVALRSFRRPPYTKKVYDVDKGAPLGQQWPMQ